MSSCILQIVELLRAGREGLVAPCAWLLAAVAAAVVFGWTSRLLLRGFLRRDLRRAALVSLAIGAVLCGGGKHVRRTGTPLTSPAATQSPRTPEAATNAVPPAAFRIADIVLADGAFAVETSWTNGLLAAGTPVDYLVKTNLLDAVWTWDGSETVVSGATGQVHAVALDRYAAASNGLDGIVYRLPPRQLFVRAVPRLPVPDLRDSDGDGLPDNYEILGNLGTNPWVPDDALAAKTCLDFVTNLQEALDRSDPYDIIELAPGEYELSRSVTLPRHPVMLCAPAPYAVVRSAASPAPFILDGAQTGQTLFRNLYVWLDARSGFQSAFWCGGSLPWEGDSAVASFRDVYVRMPHPGVQYFGWHFYRWRVDAAEISGCTLNAAGATWANGIYAYDPPPFAVRNCSFLNFPTNRLSAKACGIWLETSAANYGGVQGAVPVSISDTLFDGSFTNALPLARLERGTNFAVTARNCLAPSGFAEGHGPDVSEGLWTTNAGVAWCGVPFPGSAADTLGAGAHVVLAPGDADTDGDGDSDHDEAYVLGTDPWLADSDGDGAPDALEREQGTDPRDGQSFLRAVSVSVTNTHVSAGAAGHVCWSPSSAGWTDPRDAASFTDASFAADYGRIAVSGAVYVKAFVDLDGDGVLSAAREPFLVREVGTDRAVHRVSLAFGDVDGDGVPDTDEHAQNTNPNDRQEFRLVFTLAVTNVDATAGITNNLLIGASPWSEVPRRFTGRQFSAGFSGTVSGGGVSAVCWRDLDRDGSYTPGVDTVFSNFYGGAANGRAQTLRIGDADGDGVPDGAENAEGTDVFDKANYCVDLSVTYTDVFQTTNALTFEARFGVDTVWGPAVVTGRTWTCAFGHRVATRGERASVSVWDDVDGNGRWDAGECSNRYDIAVKAHVMNVTNTLPYGNFDRDRDNLPDWWEVQHGLSTDSDDQYGDDDGDGLINLHEFWVRSCPTNSLDCGTGTFLREVLDGIDARVGRFSAQTQTGLTAKFQNYRSGTSSGYSGHFSLNTNCWYGDVDTSCASMWNNFPWPGEFRKAGTLVSRRHVLFAAHYCATTNRYVVFMGNDGCAYTNMVVATNFISGTDIQVGLLASNMPDMVSHAKVLPQNYGEYLKDLRMLPVLQFDYDENALLFEIESPVVNYVYTDEPRAVQRQKLNHNIVVGDSGNPAFLVWGDTVVLLGCLHKGNHALSQDRYRGGGIPFVTYYASEIQSAMDALCPGYSLDYLDLSDFGKLP